jgi:hypothetical protein
MRGRQELEETLMRRAPLAAGLAGALLFAAGLALAQHHGHAPDARPAPDSRELIVFPPALVEHTLTNMRDHLAALQEISDALAGGRNDQAAKIAEERLGMSSLQRHGAHDVAKFMPQGMRDAGTAMHRAASRFAIEAQSAGATGELKPALGALGQVMSACVGCHAGYRLK